MSQSSVLIDSQQKNKVQGLIKDNRPRGNSYCELLNDNDLHKRNSSTSSMLTDNISLISSLEDENDDSRVHKPGRRSSISNYKYSIQSFLKTQFDSTVEETPDNTFLVYPASFLDTSTQGCIDKNDGTVDYYNHFFGCTSVPLEAESGVQDYFTCCQSAPPTDSYLSSRNKQLKKIDFSRSTKLQRWHIPFEPEWTDWTKEQTIFQSDDDWKNCTTDNSYRFPVNVPKQDINKAASASYSLSPSCSNSSAKYGPMLPERKNSTSSQTIKPKLQSAKQTCNLELRRVIDGLNEYAEHDLLCVKQEVKQSDGDTNQNIYEDVYQPTPFMLTLQNLIGYAQYALDTDLEVLLETKDLCADIVSKIQAVGYQWKLNKNWPCREWYVRLLLSVAALNRAIEWWQAESGVNSTLWKPSAQQEEIVQCQLQEDAKVGQSSTIVMELSLSSPTIQYLSPVWHDVIGTEPQSMIGLNISQLLLARDRNVFEVATNEMLADSRKTAEVLFCVITSDNKRMVEMEGKGMLMHNRVTGESSHTMWVIKQAGETSESVTEKQDLLLPVRLKRTNSPPSYSFELLMNIPPELCRICERWVTAVFFEQHAELCVEIHRAEMDVVDCNDKLTELRHYVQSLSDVTVNEIQDAERNVLTSEDNELIEYSRIELGKYQSLLDVTNTALSLKIPGHVEYDIEPYTCKSKVIEILFWDPPISHDEDIELLILEIQAIVRAKVDATNRMQDRLDYNERIRSNFQQQIASNENWSEFVSPETEKNTIEKVSERNNNLNDSNLSLEILTGTGEKPKEAGESLKKSIFKKIRDWKSKGKKPAIKKLNTTPMVATEIIDTPLSSPKFYNEQTSSSRKSSLSQKVQIAAGKSPCSSSPAASRPTPPSIKDFEIIKPISKGAFGSVFLAKKRITGDYYAIKFLKKSDMIAKNQVTNVKSERMIMIKQTDSPFVAKLYYTFQSKDYLYLVMEYLNGGDCSSLVKVMGSLPYDWARNYLAEVILGLAFLHNKNIIHRDLKPDNLLIDQNGHLKLTDFGLSRMGFLDRRVRDEINHEPLSFSSPFPSRSGTPPRSPSVSSASPSGPLYKNSYFNLLFEQDRHRRGSLASSVSGGEPSSLTSISPFLHEMVNSTSDDGYGVKLHRQRTNSGLLSGRTTPVFSTSEVENTPKRLMVGTPDYLAPESILGTSQDTMVDWWALGVICYEFLFGYPPFHAETPDKVFENILSRSIDWHENEVSLPPEARDFIERLLTSDPEQRLGRNGADEVRNHPFFKDLDWDNLLSEAPSFIPQPMNKEDTDYFDTRGASMMQEDVENLVKEEVKRAKAIIVEQNPDNSFVNQEEEGHEPISSDVDFGTFMYKNLPLLEKANEEAIRKIRSESIAAIATDSSKLPPSSLMAISDRKRNSIIDNMDNQCISTSLPTTPMLAMSPSVSSRTSSFTARKSEDMTNPQLEKVKKSWIEENWDVPKRVRSVSFPNKVFESKPGDGLLENDEEINIMSTPVPTSTHPLDCCGDETAYSYKSTRPLDCLIADDNPISCKILETILKSLHCRCVVVRNGAQAVRCAMGEKVLFDFIFMDIRMPIIDGEAAARMIKSTNNINKTTPIVAFTAYERTFQLSKIFDDVLSKPVTREAVIRCIKHFHDLPIDSNQMAHWPFSLPTIETPPSSFAHTPQEILSPPLTKDKQPHLPYPILPSYILSHLSKEKL